jgi:hypothetical protein
MSIVHNTKQFIDVVIDAANSNPNDGLDFNVSLSERASRKKIALVGDSYIVRDSLSVSTNPDSIGSATTSIFHATLTELKQSLEIIYRSGVSGSLIYDADTGVGTGFISRLPEALQTDADYVYVPFSVNSFKNANISMSYDQLVSYYSQAFSMIRSTNKIPITTTYFPSFFMDTAVEQLTAIRFTDWLLQEKTKSNLIVCDVRYSCADKASLTLQADQNTVEKVGGVIGNTNVHRNPAGVILDAKAMANSLKEVIPPFAIPWIYSYNASASNSRISAIQNPIMVGTTGAKDNGTTGNVASSWGVSPTSGDTCVASKVNRTDAPGEWQQIVWTPLAANRKLEFYSTPRFNLGEKVSGEPIEYMLEFEIDNTNINMIRSIFFQATFYNSSVVNIGSTIYNTDYSNSNTDIVFPLIEAPKGVVATPKFTIPSGAATVLVKFGAYSFAGGSPVTIRIGRLTYI